MKARLRSLSLSLCAGLAFGCAFGFFRDAPEPPPVSARPPPLAVDLAVFDWSQHLEEWLPAIDACLVRTPSAPAVALLAWPVKPGLVGVRTRGPGSQRWDCVARGDGAAIERFESVTPPERHPAEASPLFSRTPLEPPTGACYDHERAFDHEGRFLGWLSYDVCG